MGACATSSAAGAEIIDRPRVQTGADILPIELELPCRAAGSFGNEGKILPALGSTRDDLDQRASERCAVW